MSMKIGLIFPYVYSLGWLILTRDLLNIFSFFEKAEPRNT